MDDGAALRRVAARDPSYDLAVRSYREARSDLRRLEFTRLRLDDRRSEGKRCFRRRGRWVGCRGGGCRKRPRAFHGAVCWTPCPRPRALPQAVAIFDGSQVPLQRSRAHGQAVATQPRRDVAPRVAFAAHFVELRSQHRDGFAACSPRSARGRALGRSVVRVLRLQKGGSWRSVWAALGARFLAGCRPREGGGGTAVLPTLSPSACANLPPRTPRRARCRGPGRMR